MATVTLPVEKIAHLHQALLDAMRAIDVADHDLWCRLNLAQSFVLARMLGNAPPLVATIAPPAEPFREHVISSEVQP
jgi:hypothetical protein